MPKLNRKTIATLALSLCAATALGAGPSYAGICSGVPLVTTLAELPFAGGPLPNNTQGFLFDNEGTTHDKNLPNSTMVSTSESSLSITSLNTTSGAFTGLMKGPWSGDSTTGIAVTGTITPASTGFFTINFGYTVPGKLFTNSVYAFAGAIQSVNMPENTAFGQVCDQLLYIAGMFTDTYHGLILRGGTGTTVYGPEPFSGTNFSYTIIQ